MSSMRDSGSTGVLKVRSRSPLLNGAEVISAVIDNVLGSGQVLQFNVEPGLVLPLLSATESGSVNLYLAPHLVEKMNAVLANSPEPEYHIIGAKIESTARRNLLIADDSGFASALSLAQRLERQQRASSLVLVSFVGQVPVRLQPSQHMVEGMPGWVIAALPLLEDWGIASRVIAEGVPGCFDEDITILLTTYLQKTPFDGDIFIFGSESWTATLKSSLTNYPVNWRISVQ